MKHYLFECADEDSENCGEQFIVGADDFKAAVKIAEDFFGSCYRFGEITEEEAEMSGLDEY